LLEGMCLTGDVALARGVLNLFGVLFFLSS